jgi:hypothetical protein
LPSSAPGESPPPLPRSTHETISDLRQDVRAIVSEFKRNAATTHITVPDINRTVVRDWEGGDGKDLSVSETHTLFTIE